mmetsp:Transcript_102373/g.315889  ORF Transcript_102373/g.315889 Transcript_102373/m.315889 type:complete len:471 (+) Transcript_102373:78-1490(+)
MPSRPGEDAAAVDGTPPAPPGAWGDDPGCLQLRQVSGGSTEAGASADLDRASEGSGASRQATEEAGTEARLRPPIPCGGRDGSSYGSCFWVPPPPSNVRRIYHNRKKTSYTEVVVEEAAPRPTSQTLIGLLESESNPSRCRVMKAAYLEGDASEDSNLEDVVHAADANGWPPLLIAAQRRQADAVAALLELGAAVDCRDPSSGWTPLMYAVANGDEPTVRELLKHGASVNSFAKPSDWNALCVAIMSSRGWFVEMLLEAGADLKLIKRRHPQLAEMYTAEASKCLAWCACRPKRCLSGCKACGRPQINSAEGAAAGQRLLDDAGPSLIAAIQRGQAGEVEELLEHGTDVEHRDPGSGWTPLMYAVAVGSMSIVRSLLARGASPDAVARPSCWNALCVALLESRWEVVDLLLDHGADIDIVRRFDPDVVRSCNAEVSARVQAAERRRELGPGTERSTRAALIGTSIPLAGA